MTFAGCLTTLETHLTAAGAAITPAITDIGAGDPGIPPGRCLRYWYTGDAPSIKVPVTLTDASLMENLVIRAYFPVSVRDKPVAKALEVDCQAVLRQVKNRLIGDSTLGGNCVDLTVGDGTAGWLDVGGGMVRTVEIPLSLDFTGIDTIAP